jgi:hypothetical protein
MGTLLLTSEMPVGPVPIPRPHIWPMGHGSDEAASIQRSRTLLRVIILLLSWIVIHSLVVTSTSSLRYHALWRPDANGWTARRNAHAQLARTWLSSDDAVPRSRKERVPLFAFVYMATCYRLGDPAGRHVIQSLHTTLASSWQPVDAMVHMRCENATIIEPLRLELEKKGIAFFHVSQECGQNCTGDECVLPEFQISAKRCETMDYVAGLKLGHATFAPYVMIVEEDTWGAHDFIRKLNETVAFIREHGTATNSSKDAWVLRLFVTDFYSGFSQDMNTVVEVGAFAIVGAALGCISARLIIGPLSSIHGRAHVGRHVLIALLCCILTVLTVLSVGRQNLRLDVLNRRGDLMDHMLNRHRHMLNRHRLDNAQ